MTDRQRDDGPQRRRIPGGRALAVLAVSSVALASPHLESAARQLPNVEGPADLPGLLRAAGDIGLTLAWGNEHNPSPPNNDNPSTPDNNPGNPNNDSQQSALTVPGELAHSLSMTLREACPTGTGNDNRWIEPVQVNTQGNDNSDCPIPDNDNSHTDIHGQTP